MFVRMPACVYLISPRKLLARLCKEVMISYVFLAAAAVYPPPPPSFPA